MNTLSQTRVDATPARSVVASIRPIRRATPFSVAVILILLVVVGCAEPARPSTTTAAAATATTLSPSPSRPSSAPTKWRLASDPAHLADELVADERALRDPASSEAVLLAAA